MTACGTYLLSESSQCSKYHYYCCDCVYFVQILVKFSSLSKSDYHNNYVLDSICAMYSITNHQDFALFLYFNCQFWVEHLCSLYTTHVQ